MNYTLKDVVSLTRMFIPGLVDVVFYDFCCYRTNATYEHSLAPLDDSFCFISEKILKSLYADMVCNCLTLLRLYVGFHERPKSEKLENFQLITVVRFMSE